MSKQDHSRLRADRGTVFPNRRAEWSQPAAQRRRGWHRERVPPKAPAIRRRSILLFWRGRKEACLRTQPCQPELARLLACADRIRLIITKHRNVAHAETLFWLDGSGGLQLGSRGARR